MGRGRHMVWIIHHPRRSADIIEAIHPQLRDRDANQLRYQAHASLPGCGCRAWPLSNATQHSAVQAMLQSMLPFATDLCMTVLQQCYRVCSSVLPLTERCPSFATEQATQVALVLIAIHRAAGLCIFKKMQHVDAH